MNLDCDSVRLKLSLYMEKELEPFLRKRIERHLRDCTACQSELETLTNTVNIIKNIKASPLPRDYSKIWRSLNGLQ